MAELRRLEAQSEAILADPNNLFALEYNAKELQKKMSELQNEGIIERDIALNRERIQRIEREKRDYVEGLKRAESNKNSDKAT